MHFWPTLFFPVILMGIYTLILACNYNASFRPGEYDHSFPVLAVQISATERVELPENSNVLLKFNIPEVSSCK